MKTIKDWLKLWDLDREVSDHLIRADDFARRGMSDEADAERKQADLVRVRRDQFDKVTSR